MDRDVATSLDPKRYQTYPYVMLNRAMYWYSYYSGPTGAEEYRRA